MTDALTSAVSRMWSGGRVPTARASSSTVAHRAGAPRRLTHTVSSRGAAGRAVRINAHTRPTRIGADAAHPMMTGVGGVAVVGDPELPHASTRKATHSPTITATSA
ncbi:hypothetical protein ABZU86_28840 [Streptomyces sp. NPDC005271]|uniref:hypothetical protein n=1 Tax=unclassified Streptomyces TaxID=2593676 RepID=UPI0033BD4065